MKHPDDSIAGPASESWDAPLDRREGEPAYDTATPMPDDESAPASERLRLDGLTQRRIGNLVSARLFNEPETIRIGRYHVLQRIGRGGMGTVYAAYDEQLDRKIAVKIIGSTGKTSRKASMRLKREAQAMARLSHPNVATVHEVGDADGEVFVAMEFIRGQSLDGWIETQPEWREVLGVFLQAGQGLVAAHEAGLIHRDLKPHNIMRAEDGTVKVLDFGLARADGPEYSTERVEESLRPSVESSGSSALGTDLTRTGAVLGTPAYMAPEQHRGGSADARSDQYSFCVALYEALYRVRPFVGLTAAELTSAVLTHDMRPTPHDSRVPVWVHRIVLRGLSLDPADRWPSMQALLHALGRDPTRSRRRRLTIAGLGLVAGLAGFSISQVGGSIVAPCPSAADEAGALWSPERRARIATAFSETGSRLASGTVARISSRVDAYAAELGELRADACEAHRAGQQSARLFDLRTACLDARKAGLEELLSRFEHADALTVQNAGFAAASLPVLSVCADTEALTAAVAPPEDPQVAAEVQVQREALASARSMVLAGAYADSTAVASDAREAAVALGYEPLVAEAELVYGAALMESHQYEAAQAALSQGVEAALRSGHDEVAVEALARRMWVVADPLRRPTEALWDDSIAESLIHKLDRPPRLQWLLSNNRAVALFRAGRLREAEQSFIQALKVSEVAGEQQFPVELISTRFNLGALLSVGMGRPADAADQFRSALAQTVELLGPDHPRVVVFSAELAASLAAAGRHAEAREQLFRGLSKLSPTSKPTGTEAYLRARLMVELAAVRLHLRRFSTAAEVADEVVALADTEFSGEYLHSVGLWSRGLAKIGQGQVDVGVADLYRAIEQETARSGPEHEFVGMARWWAGRGLLQAGRNGEALTQLERAREIFAELGPSAPSYLGRQGRFLAQAYLSRGELSRAESAILEALSAQDEAGFGPDNIHRAQLLRVHADVLVARGDAAGARTLYERACDAIDQIAEPLDPTVATCRLAYAQVLESAGLARAQANKALVTFDALGIGWEQERDAARALVRRR